MNCPLASGLSGTRPTLHFDRSAWRQAGFRSRRYDWGTVIRAGHSATLWTLAAVSIWLAAALLSAIGAAMWWGTALGARLMPREREALLLRHKGLIAGYALLALGFGRSWQPRLLWAAYPNWSAPGERRPSWWAASRGVWSPTLRWWSGCSTRPDISSCWRSATWSTAAEQVIQELRQRERAR